MEIFRLIDVKNRGYLTSADFRRLCLDLDVGMTPGQIVRVFAQLDADNDGQISAKDFAQRHRAFTDIFLAYMTSSENSHRCGDVTATESFLERYDAELCLLSGVRYTFYRLINTLFKLKVEY